MRKVFFIISLFLTLLLISEDCEGPDITHEITVFPNPTEGHIQVKITNLTTDNPVYIFIYDSTGRQIYSNENAGELTPVDLTAEPNGMFIVKIIVEGKVTTWKLIKSN